MNNDIRVKIFESYDEIDRLELLILEEKKKIREYKISLMENEI